MSGSLKRTALYDNHVALGARIVEFGGWEMPVQYSGLVDEHNSVRNAVGLFDVCHMGEFELRGPDAVAFLQYVTSFDITTIPVGKANYALLCHRDGGIVDDIFVYHLPEYWLIVVNAANIEKDFGWLEQFTKDFDITLTNKSAEYGLLALQGPQAEAVLSGVAAADVVNLPFHGVVETTVYGDIPALLARTGYTGEDGFEIFVATDQVAKVWDALLADGTVKPCGLGARDSLRFEACLALYGHEIDNDINPYEAKLGWVVKLAKGEFVGSEALQQIKTDGVSRKLVGFEMVGRGIARGGYAILSTEGQPLGYVTTGMPAPTVGKNVGLGFVPSELSAEGTEFDVIIRDKPVRARVIKTPFYTPRYKR
jgi:aminomethyltransferase